MKLFKLNDNLYCVLSENRSFRGDLYQVIHEGTLKETVSHMLVLGVDESEIYAGLRELEDNDVADYGVNLKFIFAKKVA